MLRLLSIIALSATLFVPHVADSEPQNEIQILVFGGTGRLGSDISKALIREGHDVTIFVRPTSDRKRLQGLTVEYVTGDVLDESSVDQALSTRQFDVVVDALSRGRAGASFYEISARAIANNAAKHGVRQLILNGSVGAGDSADHPDYQSLPSGYLSLMQDKTRAEEAVVDSGVNYTIIRNSHLVGYGTQESGNARLYEDHSMAGSVTRQGLARLIAECVLDQTCYNKIYHAIDLTYKKTGAGI